MAYKEKYYKEIESCGHVWRLEFWQDTEETFTPVEIGPVLQSLRLVVQGDQADIDTPIVKTSLEMSFIDAPDLDAETKCGYWEEFYTSSATEFKVLLHKDGEPEWSGYVTPDSFSEDLRYRGSVAIIARDNLGTLQDSTFDMLDSPNIDGKVYMWELVQRAMTVSTCAMDLSWNDGDLPKAVGLPSVKTSASGYLLQQMVDIKAFEDTDWWTALEDTLYAVGLVIRYIGGNTLRLMPLRDMPKAGAERWMDMPAREVTFLSYGRRELVPGVKDIKETIEFDIEEQKEEIEQIKAYVPDQHAMVSYNNDEYGTFIGLLGPGESAQDLAAVQTVIPVHGYRKNRMNQYLMPEYSSLLDVAVYEKKPGYDSQECGQWEDKNIIYVAVNPSQERPVVFTRKVYSAEDAISITLKVSTPITVTRDYKYILNYNEAIDQVLSYSSEGYVECRLKYTNLETLQSLYYVNGEWKEADERSAKISVPFPNGIFSAKNAITAELSVATLHVPGPGRFEFEVARARVVMLNARLKEKCVGLYLRVKDVQIGVTIPEEANIFDKTTLTTENSDKYSVRLTREPELGINPTTAPQVVYVPKAIVAEGQSQYYGAEQWLWPNGRATLPTTGISLPRLIHQQMLGYYAKPMNLLTGELIDAEGGMPDFRSLWVWNEKPHTLISGTLNILTGRMEGATLREFIRYDHIWETWVENEDIRIDYPIRSFVLIVHSNETLTSASYSGDFGGWINLREPRYNEASKVWECQCTVYANLTGEDRVARFRIDTAEVRITQRAAGDYNDDYSQDYS